MRLTKAEQEILLDRIQLDDCIHTVLFQNEEDNDICSPSETYEYCKTAAAMVESGNIQDYEHVSEHIRNIIIESFEGSTWEAGVDSEIRAEMGAGYIVGDFNRDPRGKACNKIMSSLHRKLERWSKKRVGYPG